MNTPSFFLRAFLLSAVAASFAWAQPAIRSAGVLGNSGETGDTLVRFSGNIDARAPLNGLGVDADGFLWSFGGTGAVNRYAVDGRQLGSFPVPKKAARAKLTLSVVGNQVLLLAGEQLYSLPANAENGAAFTELPVKAKAISTSAIGNRIGVITPDLEAGVYDTVTRQAEPHGRLPEKTRANSVVLLPDGALIVDASLKISPDGVQSPVKLPGGNPVSIDGKVYSFAWHSTIQRTDDNGSPDPGVVLGGSSGSFIGTLPKDGEVNLPSGLVKIDDRRFATTSPLGVIHILEWNEQKRAFDWVRRIGAVHRSSGLGVDRQGRVWWNCGYWNWTDGPATYPRNTLHMTEDEGWQLSFTAADAMVGLSSQRGSPVLVCGPIDPEPRGGRFDRDAAKAAASLPAKSTGSVVLGAPGKEELVVVNAQGRGARLSVTADGQFRSLAGTFTIPGATAVTSLGRIPTGEVLAADGGAIVRLKAEGETWTETGRMTGMGADKFGARLHLATDGDRLWVSDAANNRVLLYIVSADGAFSAPAIFTGDEALGGLKSPGRIAARGDRAVVVDEDNQRLVKLEAVAR